MGAFITYFLSWLWVLRCLSEGDTIPLKKFNGLAPARRQSTFFYLNRHPKPVALLCSLLSTPPLRTSVQSQ